MENLTFIGQDKFCRYYRTPNHFKTVERLVLKEYVNGDSIAMRALTGFTKNMVWKYLRNDIEEYSQGRIIALSEITDEDRMVHMGKVLLVRQVDKIPINCILSGEDYSFYHSDEMINFNRAVSILKEWLSFHKQYNINPAHFILDATQRTLSVADFINNYFESRKFNLLYFKINLGIEIDEETGNVVPVWVEEGVIPPTAKILEGGKLIQDSQYLARRILPPSVYKKEIEELS